MWECIDNAKSSHFVGRHDGLPPDRRFCHFCPGQVEDEAHFLFKCPVLRHLREIYITPKTDSIPGFEFFPDNFKLKSLMDDMEYGTSKFIASATELRDFLVSKPRTME